MNAQLLEEIKKFRQMSNLPILENIGSKMLINEGKSDSAISIWRMILQTGEATAEANANRLARLTRIFDDYKVKFSTSNVATEAEELALRRGVVDEINTMVRYGRTVKEIVDFLASKLGKEEGGLWARINNSIDDYVDQEVKDSITKSLTNPNDPVHISLVKDFTAEVSERMEKMDKTGESPLVKKAVLDGLKADFIKTYKTVLGFDIAIGEGKAVDDLFEIPYKSAVKGLTPASTQKLTTLQGVMASVRNFPQLIADLFELFNLFYLSRKTKITQIEKEIEELVIAIETGGATKSAGKLISDRIKVLIKSQGDELQSYVTLYDQLITKIKNAIPDTKKGNALLEKIEEIEKLDVSKSTNVEGQFAVTVTNFKRLQELFEGLEVKPTDEGADIWNSFMKKLKELYSFWKPLRKIKTDGANKIIESYRGWFFRFANYLITGTLSTFKEYMEEMSKIRTNYNIFNRKQRKVSGWGSAAVIDMYIRIWIRANIMVPLAVNFINGLAGVIWICGTEALGSVIPGGIGDFIQPKDETFNKWCSSAVGNFARDTIGDFGDTFTPILGLVDTVFGSDFDSKLNNASIGLVFWEIWDMVIPFNTKLDSLYYLLTYDFSDDVKKLTDKKNNEEKRKTEEETVNKIDPKLYAKKELQVTYGKNAVMAYAAQDPNYNTKLKTLSDLVSLDSLSQDTDPMITYNSKIYHLQRNRGGWSLKGDGYTYTPKEFVDLEMGGIKTESIIRKFKNILMEESGKKFGDDNFKHWKDTFTFKAMDEKNPGQYKEVKINMEDVMDRVNHYRKKYDEDDSFVRAVIDTHEDVVKIMFTKDLAHLQENFKPTGLAIILQQIRESRGEMEIWSVARPANGNWFLVKGDYTPNQLVNMDLEKNEPQPKEKEVDSRTEDDLKKKEVTALQRLKNNENDGIDELPKQVKDKIKEKLSRGWTTEEPFFAFSQFYETSEINTVFNDKIKIYKLKPSDEFFKTLVRESASIRLKKGFCKSLNEIKNKTGLVERQQKVLNHFVKKCEDKFGNIELKKYRQSRFDA